MKKEKLLDSNSNKPKVTCASVSPSSSSFIPPTTTISTLSPLTPSPTSTAPALTTKSHPVLPSPLGESADKFKETLMKQQKALEDWFEDYFDER